MIDAIVGACEGLTGFPEMGRRRPEFDAHGLEVRSLIERSYVIFYVERAGDLQIVRILHHSQDVDSARFEGLTDIAE